MRRKFGARIDFLTFKLTPGFDAGKVFAFAKTPIADPETGEVSRVMLREDQYNVYYNPGNNTTVSFYRGGEILGLNLAAEHKLKATRVDVAVDFDFASEKDLEKGIEYYDAIITDYLRGKNSQASKITFEGKKRENNTYKGFNYWARSGDKHLRLYGKQLNGAYFGRLEWQIRGPVAQQIVDAIADSYPADNLKVFSAFQEITAMYLSPDIFSFGDFEAIELKKPETGATISDIEGWAKSVVAKSFVRHFHTTKVKLWEVVNTECIAILMAEMNNEVSRETTYHEKKEARFNARIQKAKTSAREEAESYN